MPNRQSAQLFEQAKPILGCVKLLPLPGSLGFRDAESVISRAEQEATALASGGVHGILIESISDASRLDTAAAVLMGLIVRRIAHLTQLPVGVSVLPNDPESALGIAFSSQAQFIRLPLALGTMVGENGLLEGKLAQLAAYRHQLKADHKIKIFADISRHHVLPGIANPQADTYLRALAQSLAGKQMVDALLVNDQEVTPEQTQELTDATPLPVVVINATQSHLGLAYFQASAGIILEAGTRKTTTSIGGGQMLPTVDMIQVEEITNRLQAIKPFQAMSPDFFVGEKPGQSTL